MLHATLLFTALALAPVPADSALRSTVVWTPETYATMSFLYQRITASPDGVEFAACLRARRDGPQWVVTEVVIPAQSGNTPTSVDAVDCTGYEGTAHSHPLSGGQRHCFPSPADRAAFAGSGNQFFVIWCDTEAFTFRTVDRGIGGKDDVTPDREISTSPEPHIWRSPAAPPL